MLSKNGKNESASALDPASSGAGMWSVILRRARGKYRELGLLGTLGLLPKNLRRWAQVYVDQRYDRRHGVSTAGYTPLHELVISSPNKEFGIRYQPTTHKQLVAMFQNLPPDLSDFTFVDFGSGRGRVLLFAARFNFKQVVGVEFSEELHRSAMENIAAAAGLDRGCHDIRPTLQDATLFPIPDGPLVLYFFDPFRDQVMRQVVDNITRSYLAAPRKIYVMYLAPVHEEMVLASGIFSKVAVPELPYEVSLPTQYRFAFFEAGSAAG